jgi:hypothetical protein
VLTAKTQKYAGSDGTIGVKGGFGMYVNSAGEYINHSGPSTTVRVLTTEKVECRVTRPILTRVSG